MPPLSTGYAESMKRIAEDFSTLVGSVIGRIAAEDIYYRTLERNDVQSSALDKIISLAAFFLGEYDNDSMTLDGKDWEDIQETLEETSGEIDIDTLCVLMGELVSRHEL
jgi:hypothetical protein